MLPPERQTGKIWQKLHLNNSPWATVEIFKDKEEPILGTSRINFNKFWTFTSFDDVSERFEEQYGNLLS